MRRNGRDAPILDPRSLATQRGGFDPKGAEISTRSLLLSSRHQKKRGLLAEQMKSPMIDTPLCPA